MRVFGGRMVVRQQAGLASAGGLPHACCPSAAAQQERVVWHGH